MAAELDAASVVRRMETAVRSRRVTVRPAPDGMAHLTVLGPLKDVVGAHAALLRRARAVVVPSTYEGFGLPALEGMACGVPVVAARCGALPEVCEDASLLVEPNGEAIAKGVETVLTNHALAERLGERGRRRASDFDWDHAAAEHLRVYRAALGMTVN